MNGTQYQRMANRTRQPYPSKLEELVFAALELTAEAGEVANLVYKAAFQQHPIDLEHLKEEIGDALWGMAVLCDAGGFTLDDVMEANIAKLRKRYPNGWTREASLARVDHSAPAQPPAEMSACECVPAPAVPAPEPVQVVVSLDGVRLAQLLIPWANLDR